MFLIEPGADEAQEWAVALRAVQDSVEIIPDVWAALRECPVLEIYTDGSAPVRNPGGPAGFAAIVVGYLQPIDLSEPQRSPPYARADIGGYVAARMKEPRTSNNRAEIGGVLAALEALKQLERAGTAPRQVNIWSDSTYVVMCARGKWKRKKNTDLWHAYDLLAAQVGRDADAPLPNPFTLEWVKGHAGNEYNEAADVLASLAAFNFDQESYARLRAAQASTGREMPGEAALASVTAAEAQTHHETADFESLFRGADYTLLLQSGIDSGGRAGVTSGPARGRYHLEAKNGSTHRGQVEYRGNHLPDEAEYLTLIVALEDLVGRISSAGSDPSTYTLTIYSARELVVKQLSGVYKVKSPALREVYARTLHLLRRFKQVELIKEQAKALAGVLKLG